MSRELVGVLLEAPDSQLDSKMKPLIRKWADPPRAIQVLEVLDACIHASLASGAAIVALQTLYEDACRAEGVTHQTIAEQATWRNGNGKSR